MTATKQIPISHVFSTDKRKLEEFLFDKTLSQVYSTEQDKSKGIIVNECSTEEGEPEHVHRNINKQKDTNNEAEYEEPKVTYELMIFLNILLEDVGNSI